MKTTKIMMAAMLLCSVAFTSCKKETTTKSEMVLNDTSYSYIVSDDAKDMLITMQKDGIDWSPKIYTISQYRKTRIRQDTLAIGYNTIAYVTPSKIASWDAASGGSVSTPTNLASGSRVINTSTVSATSYSVATRTRVDISCGADINIGVLGSGTGFVYLETLKSGSSTWVRRGVVTKIKGSLIGLNTGNGGTYGVNLDPGDSYRLISSTTISGIGNTITYSMDGGSYYTY